MYLLMLLCVKFEVELCCPVSVLAELRQLWMEGGFADVKMDLVDRKKCFNHCY